MGRPSAEAFLATWPSARRERSDPSIGISTFRDLLGAFIALPLCMDLARGVRVEGRNKAHRRHLVARGCA